MTPEQFWSGDPYLVVAYNERYKLEQEIQNKQMWWQGAYVREAQLSALSGAMFWIKKQYKYPEEPYRITPYSKEEKVAQAEKERQKAIKQLTAWKDAWDRNAKQ